MNAQVLLLALLALAYVGSRLFSSREGKGSLGVRLGAEYLVVGFVAGPTVLGVADRSTVAGFEPIVVAALGWIAMGIGLEWGRPGGRRAGPRGTALGIAFAIITAFAVGAATYTALGYLHLVGSEWQRRVLAGAAGTVLADTTRHAARWVVGRHGARGPLTELIADLSDTDDAVPLIAFGAVMAFGASGDVGRSPWLLLGATLVLGVVLGGLLAALVRSEPPVAQTWGYLLGASLLASGTAARLDLSAPTVGFAVGLTLRVASRFAPRVARLVLPTEQVVLLPVFVLAGAMVDIQLGRDWLVLLAVALGARLAVKAALGALLPAGDGASVGLGLAPSGALAVVLALTFQIRNATPAGSWVLALAVASMLVGELVGAGTLKASLERAGEIVTPAEPDADAERAP